MLMKTENSAQVFGLLSGLKRHQKVIRSAPNPLAPSASQVVGNARVLEVNYDWRDRFLGGHRTEKRCVFWVSEI